MPDNTRLKRYAENFLRLAASGKVDEAFSEYVEMDFIHHNQYYKGDRDSLMQGMKESAFKSPDKLFEMKFVLQEEEKVMTYSHLRMHSNDMEIAVFHMFKFRNDKIVEMWDVGQQIAKESLNENGMF